MMKHRGHFLLSGDIKEIREFKTTFKQFVEAVKKEELDFALEIEEEQYFHVEQILKNNQIDMALFCELVSHKDFIKLLADIQIYVEGIAAMQIENLNIWVDTARDEIIKKYKPESYDKNLYLLKAAHIQEKEYFTQRIHRDIDFIIDDLRESPKAETTALQKIPL